MKQNKSSRSTVLLFLLGVALIVAAKGNAVGLMSSSLLGPVVVVVVITTIISPILLKLSFSEKSGKVEYEQNEYARLMEEAEAAGKSDASRYVGGKQQAK